MEGGTEKRKVREAITNKELKSLSFLVVEYWVFSNSKKVREKKAYIPLPCCALPPPLEQPMSLLQF